MVKLLDVLCISCGACLKCMFWVDFLPHINRYSAWRSAKSYMYFSVAAVKLV